MRVVRILSQRPSKMQLILNKKPVTEANRLEVRPRFTQCYDRWSD